MNKVISMGIGLLILSALFVTAIVFRPFWMKVSEPLNNTVYNLNTSEGIAMWGRVRNTINNNFWLIPIVGALIVLAWIYLTMSEKEYVATGYFR